MAKDRSTGTRARRRLAGMRFRIFDRRPPLVHHLVHQGLTGRGELEDEVASIGRIVAPAQQAGPDHPVHRSCRVRRMHTEPGGHSAQVQRPPVGHHRQHAQLRQRRDVVDRRHRLALIATSNRVASTTASTSGADSSAAPSPAGNPSSAPLTASVCMEVRRPTNVAHERATLPPDGLPTAMASAAATTTSVVADHTSVALRNRCDRLYSHACRVQSTTPVRRPHDARPRSR
jgi:hypothetical protein